MVVSSTNAIIYNAPPVPIPLFTNRFQPLEGLSHDEQDAEPDSTFHAQGVYKPPHMRESVASITGSDPTVSSTPTVCPAHGSSLDHEGKGSRTPHTPTSAPGSAVFGFGEVKKKIHEELLIVRKAMEEMEIIEKEFLEEEARFVQELQALRSTGLTDEEIRDLMGSTPINFPPRPPSVKPLDVNVGICLDALASGMGLTLSSTARYDRLGTR